MRKEEVERMRELLVEAITTLCRSGLKYSSAMRVEGLLGVTLDEEDIILVNVNKTYNVPKPEDKTVQKPKIHVEVENQSDGEVSNEPTPSPVDSRTGQLDDDENNRMVSIKREPPDESPRTKRFKVSHSSSVPPVDSSTIQSRVPPIHPDSAQDDSSWTQNIQSEAADDDSRTMKSSNSASDNTFFQEMPESDLASDAQPEQPSGQNVKIEISSESESEDTMYSEQSQYGGQEGSLYGVPVDMQGATMFDPGAIPGTSGAADFTYGDGSFQDQSMMGTPSGSGKVGMNFLNL